MERYLRTEKEMRNLKSNLSKMSLVEILLFFRDMDKLDFEGFSRVHEEIESRIYKN